MHSIAESVRSGIPAALLCAAVAAAGASPAQAQDSWTPADPGEAYKACPDAVWPGGSGDDRRVLVLGDSLTNYAYRPLNARLTADGWLPTIVCWGGMQTDWGLTQAKDVAARHFVPDRVVVAFGTNDVHKNPCYTSKQCNRQIARFGRRAHALLDYLGPDRQVWWLNIDMDADRAARALGEPWNRNFGKFNAELAKVVSQYPNAELIDWRGIVTRAARKHPIPRTSDGLHYAPTDRPRASRGTMLRVRTIAKALR